LKNYYTILGVSETAGDEEIKRAYRSLAKRWHPDKNPGRPLAEEKFKEIVEAYEALSDPILRRRHDLRLQYGRVYDPGTIFYTKSKTEEKRDRRRAPPEYSEGFLRWKKEKQDRDRRRRRVLLVGMIIAFIGWVTAAQLYESYLDDERKLADADAERRLRIAMAEHDAQQKRPGVIENLDSPFDPVFGDDGYDYLTPNTLVVDLGKLDAVVCLEQADAPFRTIRNEFVYGGNSFSLTNLPYGSYRIKLCTGKRWDISRSMLGGKVKGAFSSGQQFYRVEHEPFVFIKPTSNNPFPRSADTIALDPSAVRLVPISEAEFFNLPKNATIK